MCVYALLYISVVLLISFFFCIKNALNCHKIMLQCYVNCPKNGLHFLYSNIYIYICEWSGHVLVRSTRMAHLWTVLSPYLAEANPVRDVCPSATLPQQLLVLILHPSPSNPLIFLPLPLIESRRTVQICPSALWAKGQQFICGNYGPHDDKQCLILTSFLSFRQEPT